MSTLSKSTPPTSNLILNALTQPEFEQLAPSLEPMRLWIGEVLYRPDEPIKYVYFPNRGTISLVSLFESGESVEVGMVGNEGMFGVCVFLGSVSNLLEAIVQLPGDALRLPAAILKKEFARGGLFQDLLLRYTQAFITQIAQNAACNRAHNTEQRLARWLLMCQDRSQTQDLEVTQEFIATMLGTRRASVTVAAGLLKDAGIISYTRGHVQIIDRQKLEAMSCECYSTLKNEFHRYLPGNTARET